MRKLRFFLSELIWFGIRQAQACIFAGAMLAGIILSKWLWQADFLLPRYDFLFLYALFLQVILVTAKMETWEEVRVILVFHLVGTVMEIFKTHVGSWAYPEENYIRIAGVPLFSGFMYSSVGSYIARIWRLIAFKFQHFPSRTQMSALCLLIYINFFSHHYILDMRYVLFLLSAYVFGRTRVYYKPHQQYYWMPLFVGFWLVAFFIWLGENVGTFGSIWIYPSQKAAWHIVSMAKMGSWFLLMIISFTLVSLLHAGKDEQKIQ